ncbi:MAG TPA: hypothetical protein VMM79_01135 [Longimicrobiales bacterium]|nr:hypothetical protein [Longimicrobiales bacterium]
MEGKAEFAGGGAAVAAVWGGDEAGMDAVYEQEGVRHGHLSTTALRNRKMVTQRLFNPSGAVPGQRDAALAFIRDLVRAFHDGGVPLLIGSDSRTVVLISGFSILEAQRSAPRACVTSSSVGTTPNP